MSKSPLRQVRYGGRKFRHPWVLQAILHPSAHAVLNFQDIKIVKIQVFKLCYLSIGVEMRHSFFSESLNFLEFDQKLAEHSFALTCL